MFLRVKLSAFTPNHTPGQIFEIATRLHRKPR